MVEKKKVKKKARKKKPGPLKGEEALAKAREGPDAWNTWAEKNPGRTVNFFGVDFTTDENKGVSFSGFTFPGDANFSDAEFLNAGFHVATFKKHAGFDGATFKGNTVFRGATFEGTALFGGATFEGDARFGGATFTGPVILEKSQFQIVPDFRLSEFKKHVTLHGMEVKFRRSTEKTDADMYRRLKELAFDARDHDRAQEFFAYELMAKRGHETRGRKLIPNHLYGWTSDFGRGLLLPCIWLCAVWSLFGFFYHQLATKDTRHFLDALSYSAAQLSPFLGASQGARGGAKAALFREDSLGMLVNFIGMVEGVLGILFLFLIGLALRNRFRI